MAEHIGIVIQMEENGRVRVAADRKGACGGRDHRGGGCKSYENKYGRYCFHDVWFRSYCLYLFKGKSCAKME